MEKYVCMTPLEVLHKELDILTRALSKSKQELATGLITEELAKTHQENLTPKIQEYKDAIRTLKIFGK